MLLEAIEPSHPEINTTFSKRLTLKCWKCEVSWLKGLVDVVSQTFYFNEGSHHLHACNIELCRN